MSQRSRWWRNSGEKPWMMGVLNCTPDSFSDGGKFAHIDAAIAQGMQMRDVGAHVIDVGGESTRPGAEPVSLTDELNRVIPVIEVLVQEGCYVSIDTMKTEVMRQAIQAGAQMVNDVSALADVGAEQLLAETGIDLCLMHMQGTPKMMQEQPHYHDVVADVMRFLSMRVEQCLAQGILASSIMIDPGIGFGKSLSDNLALIHAIPQFREQLNMPVLMGVSRKSFLGAITGATVDQRELESAAAVTICAFLGADMLRVHDVAIQQRAAWVGAACQWADPSNATDTKSKRVEV
ncbi:MAG: dihydropteroate synthase [Zetaproteobacteria bacterium]|nr:dihydropteroate synthase [Zetaproteobacteria bacterium]